jgi:hypothetical protein
MSPQPSVLRTKTENTSCVFRISAVGSAGGSLGQPSGAPGEALLNVLRMQYAAPANSLRGVRVATARMPSFASDKSNA